MHLGCLAVFFVDVPAIDWVLAGVLYLVRMFGITAGYHRYFAHRSYKTSRAFQFFLAVIGCSSLQKGPLWWAAHHRHHHRYSDEPQDRHSPVVESFWYSHVGWILDRKNDPTDYAAIRDFARYPELVSAQPLSLGSRPPFGSSVLRLQLVGHGQRLGRAGGVRDQHGRVYHFTFMINSLAHVFGSRRYETTDDSRNNFGARPRDARRGLAQQPPPLPKCGSARVFLVGSGPELLWAQDVELDRARMGLAATAPAHARLAI